MSYREPDWWYADELRWQARVLAPMAWVYGAAARARYASATPFRAARPVICIGNFTAGGAGKTPSAIAIAQIIRELGFAPWSLSRGYGGAVAGPVRVDPGQHTAADLGDEPILLAAAMPSVVSRDRAAGARFIADTAPGNAIILMDDGMQNPTLNKDLTIAVMDRTRGVGNGCVIPAGPLRAPLALQIPLADALIINGARETELSKSLENITRNGAASVFSAWPVAAGSDGKWRGKRVIAFAGIANPDRFFQLLERLGADVAQKRVFADHHTLSDAEAMSLLGEQERFGATLVTTEKDAARLKGCAGARAELGVQSAVFAIKLEFAALDRDALKNLIANAIARRTGPA